MKMTFLTQENLDDTELSAVDKIVMQYLKEVGWLKERRIKRPLTRI